MKPCIFIARNPLNKPETLTAICGKDFEKPELVPAFDEGELPTIRSGMFHPKCEKALSEMELSGEVLLYAVLSRGAVREQ